MFAKDLKIPVEYSNKASFSQNVDIFINFRDEDDVYNKSNVEMIWPHYQNRYCFIYTNTKLIVADGIFYIFSAYLLMCYMVMVIKFIFFYIVLRYR